ncbi:MAG TPA: hypothetical protein VJ302_10815 [Blastocatellia bacterium]|nr:hypothetical protein [Blastocatellia bacterium]
MPIFRSRRPGGGRPTKKKPFGASKPGGKPKGKKKRAPKRAKKKKVIKPQQPSIESTGMEALYLKELIEDEKMVVVVLNTGETVRGYVRYYDRDVFSIGPADGSPKIFLRKSGIRYLYEE